MLSASARSVVVAGISLGTIAALASPLAAQNSPPPGTSRPGATPTSTSAMPGAAMHWREIGPTRAGRARALAGVPSQRNVFYAGFDNGGVWRSTDYGSTWHPIFDGQPTGSIGAIAIPASDPNTIYVGTGAGIIRPDLSIGNGVYKSTDAGKTWTHLGLDDTQMIANIDVDPRDANHVLVAALGHPYGPNAERGIYRSNDGGRTFTKTLYLNEYTSANDVRIDPTNPNVVYAALWVQQQSFIEGGGFGGPGGNIYKSMDGGTTWRKLAGGLPDSLIEANLAIAQSNSNVIYAAIASAGPNTPAARRATGDVALYKSTDAGEHWSLVVADAPPTKAIEPKGPEPRTSNGREATARVGDPRPMLRIGGGDLPTLAVDPRDERVLYSSSIVFWRSADGGVTWTAVRGSPGGDDYQKTWINPIDPNIILEVSDQGAVVSANRGASWSNWYTQPTAAMYHVTTDDAFPYNVCGGQQDSGSACVASRSPDGEITMHDWHPANIQEYGIAAPDPKDPDIVYASARTNVSRYDRRTGQTTQVGPDALARGTAFGRNVRTMPIMWSPIDSTTLYYTSNVVWKTRDHGTTWSRISPDLTRATWTPPASAGRYAATVTPGPAGSITAFSASPRDVNVLWTGSDDGMVQTTRDGGATWSNVTPPAIKPWTRIFNLDAGHFDTRTAYIAANTLRIDDANPHFFRTHDGGATWTEIDAGIAPGAAANSIREDPRVPGLLYASTDNAVSVSFDDGGHWESLQLDMPAVSVRDIAVKDDASCLCSDLVAATHGRGFWILDDVTPLRQAAALRAAAAARKPFLFAPQPAVRMRFAMNEPTPWPPELPAGENPPYGAVIDYYLPERVTGPVTLEIADASGRVVRTYSSSDPVADPHPALEPMQYNVVCQRDPEAPDCALPFYWPAPPTVVSRGAGMHRVNWDMHFDPLAGEGVVGGGGDGDGGAVPHRTYPVINAPWAPPGVYTIRLTVNGVHYTQQLPLRLDPRVRTSADSLAQVATRSREMYDAAVAAHAAYVHARAFAASIAALPAASRSPELAAFTARLDSLAPAAGAAGGGGGGGFRRGGGGSATLNGASNAAIGAAMSMQAADVGATAAQIAACDRAATAVHDALARWNALTTTELSALNAARKRAGHAAIVLPPAPREHREAPERSPDDDDVG